MVVWDALWAKIAKKCLKFRENMLTTA